MERRQNPTEPNEILEPEHNGRPPEMLLLSPRQEAAVDLMAAGFGVTEVAKKLEVSRWTVSMWRSRNPEFRAALNERRKELWSGLTDRLRSLLPAALDLIERQIRRGNVNAALSLVKSVGPIAIQILKGEQQERQGTVFNDNRSVIVGKDYDTLKELTPLQRDTLRRRMQAELLEVRKLAPDK
jgi:hypothetical protein